MSSDGPRNATRKWPGRCYLIYFTFQRGWLRRLEKKQTKRPASHFLIPRPRTSSTHFPNIVKTILLLLVFLSSLGPAQASVPFISYLRQTANNGDAESQLILGLAYRDGWNGTIKTDSFLAKLHTLSVELHDERPNLFLRRLLQDAEPITQDKVTAQKLLSLAAEQGDDYARVILGEMLLEGDGVPSDWISGAEWIRKSAATGFVPAQFRMGLVYLVGGKSTPQDDVEALAWFIVAAESGSKVAKEFRDEQTQLLGREIARLAIKRSRVLLVRAGTIKNPAEESAPSEHARS